MNFMESPYPHSLRAGFWVFLQSERARHLEDVRKIDEIIVELEKITPSLKDGKIRESMLKFAERFTEFEM